MSSSTNTAPGQGEAGHDPLESCTLPPDALGERLAWIRAEILPHAVATERISGGVAWELDDAPGLAAKLDRLVELERECCSGIVLSPHPRGPAGRRRLEVLGIDPDADVLAGIHPAAGRPQPLGRRLARAAGLGTLLGLLLCCALPLAATALLGASAAALLALDTPWVIASAALVCGAGAFALQGRALRAARTRDASGTPCGTGC